LRPPLSLRRSIGFLSCGVLSVYHRLFTPRFGLVKQAQTGQSVVHRHTYSRLSGLLLWLIKRQHRLDSLGYIGPMPGGPPMPGNPSPPPIGVPGNGGFAVSARERSNDGSTFFKS